MLRIFLLALLSTTPPPSVWPTPDAARLPTSCRQANTLNSQDHAALKKALAAATQCVSKGGGADALVLRAHLQLELGNPDAALADLSKALKLSPFSAAVRYDRGLLYLAQNNPPAAIEDFTAAIEINGSDADALIERGHAYALEDRQALAIKDFSLAIQLRPNQATGFQRRGMSEASLAEFSNAIADETRAIQLAPDDDDSYYDRAMAFAGLGDYRHAISDYDVVLAHSPNDPDALSQRGASLQALGDLEPAVKDFTASLAIRSDPTVLNDRAIAFEAIGQVEAALADFSAAVEADPTAIGARQNRARLNYLQKNYAEAISDLDRLLSTNSNQPNLLRMRGFAYFELKDCKKSIVDFSTALALQPNSTGDLLNRALCYETEAQFDLAADDLTKAIAIRKDDADALAERGFVYDRLARFDLALDDLTTAIGLVPDRPQFYEMRASALVDMGHFMEATSDYDRALAIDETSATALNGRCWALALSARDLVQALKDCKDAVQIAPNSAATIDSLAFAQFRSGDLQSALANFERAFALDPAQTASLYMRGIVRVRLGQSDAGYLDIAAALRSDPTLAGRYQSFGVRP